MRRADMDRMVDEHFRHEANDDVEGVLATFADDCSHRLTGSSYGRLTGKSAIRAFYEELFASISGDHVEPVRRLHGNQFVIDDSIWTGTIADGRIFGLPGRSGPVSFALLHVLEFRDGLIRREEVWPDTAAITAALDVAATGPRS